MFATPLVAPLQGSLIGHVFGRFLTQLPQDHGSSAAPPGADAAATPWVVEDDEIDLAQRVREMGEW
ncbi:MAG: hypothetical protein RBS27_13005 [Giesbergeria sp.]|jgi:hypothetical protein|nr:hypothetical protein [Giesbergeria sp.]